MKTIVKTFALVIAVIICLSLCGCASSADMSEYLSAPTAFSTNSGAVYLKMNSISEETIKYATFTLEAFNAVGDSLEVETIKITGPIENGDELIASDSTIFMVTYDNEFISKDVEYVVIVEVELEFTDGKIVKGSYDYSTADFTE